MAIGQDKLDPISLKDNFANGFLKANADEHFFGCRSNWITSYGYWRIVAKQKHIEVDRTTDDTR